MASYVAWMNFCYYFFFQQCEIKYCNKTFSQSTKMYASLYVKLLGGKVYKLLREHFLKNFQRFFTFIKGDKISFKSKLNFFFFFFLQYSLFYVLVLWPWGVWDLSLLTRDWTLTPYIERSSLNHWSTGKVPLHPYLCVLTHLYLLISKSPSLSVKLTFKIKFKK